MKKITVAICDRDTAYLDALLDYLLQEACEKIAVTVYSEISEYQSRSNRHDIALLTKEFWKQSGYGEEGTLRLYFSGGEVPDGVKQEQVVEKYQRADELVRQLFYIWERERGNEEIFHGVCRNKEVYGIYAPGSHDGQMIFSLLLGKELAREKKVLYLNFMEGSGLSVFCEQDWQRDLGDLMAMLQRKKVNFGAQLESVVHTLGNLYYVPPMRNPVNLYEMDGKSYEKLLSRLLAESDYEVILLDFGSLLAGFYKMLEQMDGLYCLNRSGRFLEKQQENFLTCIRQYDEALLERVRAVYLPREGCVAGEGPAALEQLQYSVWGDHVRTLLGKGGSYYGTENNATGDTGDQGACVGEARYAV